MDIPGFREHSGSLRTSGGRGTTPGWPASFRDGATLARRDPARLQRTIDAAVAPRAWSSRNDVAKARSRLSTAFASSTPPSVGTK